MQEACFSHKGDSGFISNSRGIRQSFSFPLLATCKAKLIALCPQLHQVVVKHKVSILVKQMKIIKQLEMKLQLESKLKLVNKYVLGFLFMVASRKDIFIFKIN